jgi:hypothetical protein
MASLNVDQTLDYVALVGYASVFAFSLYNLSNTFGNPVDLVGNVLLLVGLGGLIFFHHRKIQTGNDVDNDPTQKKARIVAHTCITAFFLITLVPMSKAVYRFYDNFGLAAHAFLAYAVYFGEPQLLGVALLAFYFMFATYRKTQVSGMNMESLNLVGRFLLLTYFVTSLSMGTFKLFGG